MMSNALSVDVALDGVSPGENPHGALQQLGKIISLACTEQTCDTGGAAGRGK